MKKFLKSVLMLSALVCGVTVHAQTTTLVVDDLQKVGTYSPTRWTYGTVICSSTNPVTSITLFMTNSTAYTVPSTPSRQTYNSLSTNPKTTVFVFNTPISAAEVETFIKGIIFRRNSNTEEASVAITIDANPTHLPTGATITVWDGHPDGSLHYYVWVPRTAPVLYRNSYNEAKSYWFQGMRGYLTTIVTAEEDKRLTQISANYGWSGGARTPDPVRDQEAYPDVVVDPAYPNHIPTLKNPAHTDPKEEFDGRYYRWLCGPETGFEYYYHAPTKAGDYNNTPEGAARSHPLNNAYNSWSPLSGGTEPNNSDVAAGGENVMQVNYTGLKWNDYAPSNNSIKGYFIEFGGTGKQYSATTTNGTATYPANPLYDESLLTIPPGNDGLTNNQWVGFSPGNRATTVTSLKSNVMRSRVLIIE
jgi:hypothetical protein